MKLNDIAQALTICCTTSQIADIISSLLSCDDDSRLTDDQADAGCELFHALCELSPEAAELSQTN